jgi:DNA-binding winged helix-turn-helix (wHTH) protein
LTHVELYNSTEKVKTLDSIVIINEHYSYSLKSLELYYDKEVVKLNKKQTKLLAILVENIGITVDYEMLVSHIWETESISGSSLRTLVYSLRKQLPDLPILSFSKMGYALHVEE